MDILTASIDLIRLVCTVISVITQLTIVYTHVI